MAKGAGSTGQKAYDAGAADEARRHLQRFIDEYCESSREKAGRKLGYDKSSITRVLEKRLQPPLPMLLGLRRHMKITLDELLGKPAALDGDDVRQILQRLDDLRELLEDRLPRRKD